MFEDDSTLAGVVNFFKWHEENGHFVITAQVFQNIYYHFNWISEITGIDLPKC